MKILNYWFFIDIINPIWVYPSVLYVFPLVSFVFSFTFWPWVSWRRLWVFFCLFSLCNHWKLHADILIKSECVCLSFFFYISGGLTRGLKLLFMAGSACWSVTKSDWIPEFVWPFLLFRFFLFSWPGTRLAQQHFRVFPSSSDQFKVISAWSGSQAVKKKEIQKESKGIRRRGGGGL